MISIIETENLAAFIYNNLSVFIILFFKNMKIYY